MVATTRLQPAMVQAGPILVAFHTTVLLDLLAVAVAVAQVMGPISARWAQVVRVVPEPNGMLRTAQEEEAVVVAVHHNRPLQAE
jgi:hypothetical protein